MNTGELAGLLDERAASHTFSGVALAWVDGEEAFSHAAGVAHRGLDVPMTIHHRFRVASITKMITATAVMRLIEGGAFALETPVTDLLPAEMLPNSATDAMTVDHLLSHTSGLANYHDEDDDTFDSYMACWDVVPPHRAREPHDLLPLFTDKPARFSPGECFSYGDVNYIVLGMILAERTGRRFREVAHTEVLEPAGMVRSTFGDLDTDPPLLAVGYLASDQPPDLWPTNTYVNAVGGMPDGGLITTAADLCAFVDAYRSDLLVSEESRRLMQSSYGRINDDVEHYGYGMEMWVEDGEPTIFGHAGGDPGVSCIVSHYVAEATTVVVLCNHDRGSWAAAREVSAALGITDPRV